MRNPPNLKPANVSKLIFSISFVILVSFTSVAQQVEEPKVGLDTAQRRQLEEKLSLGRSNRDSIIAAYYYNDTLGFKTYPQTVLLDSIIPNRMVAYWELDKLTRYNNDSIYSCLYKSTTGVGKETDSSVLIRSEQGLGPTCIPGSCVWYISCKMRDGKKVALTNPAGLRMFVGGLDNYFDAYLLLHIYRYSSTLGYPMHVEYGSSYKRVKGGYLISIDPLIADCPVKNAKLIYFVSDDKRIVFIQVLSVEVSDACI